MQKAKKQHIRTLLCAVILMFIVVLSASVVTAFGYDFHGIDISDRESIDAYYMDIDLSDYKGFHCGVDGSLPAPDFWSRKNERVALLFSFPEVSLTNTATGSSGVPYLVSETTVNCPSRISNNTFNISNRYDFTESVFTLSLSNNFYKVIKDSPQEAAFSTVEIMLIWQNKGYATSTAPWFGKSVFTARTTFYSVAVSPGVTDPESPDFDINFGNNGDVTLPDSAPSDGEPSDWDQIWDWLTVNWKMVAIVMLGAIAGGIFLKILFWVFK